MKIYRVSLNLSANGFKWHERELDAVEKNMTYIIPPQGDPSSVDYMDRERRIKKEAIMRPNNITYDTHKMIGYSVWCLEHQVEEAKAKLENKVRSTATYIKEEAEKMFKHL